MELSKKLSIKNKIKEKTGQRDETYLAQVDNIWRMEATASGGGRQQLSTRVVVASSEGDDGFPTTRGRWGEASGEVWGMEMEAH